MCVEVTVAVISSSDQKSWTEDNCLFSVNSSLRLNPGISFESGEAVSGKYFISLSRTQPLPPHTRGRLCWYLTTFFNYSSCRTQALTDLVVLSVPFGCILIHGSDMHLPVWWMHVCCLLPSYLYLSKRFKLIPQTVHARAEAGWICRVLRAAVSRSWIFSLLQIAHFSISLVFAYVWKQYFLW